MTDNLHLWCERAWIADRLDAARRRCRLSPTPLPPRLLSSGPGRAAPRGSRMPPMRFRGAPHER